MKEITVNDCIALRERFLAYCDTAGQHEFALLFMIHMRMDTTIEMFKRAGEVKDQKDMRAMFRVVLKIMGEDYSEYAESEDRNENRENFSFS